MTITADDLEGGKSVHSKTKMSVIAVSDVDGTSNSDDDDLKSKKFVEEERPPVNLDQEALK